MHERGGVPQLDKYQEFYQATKGGRDREFDEISCWYYAQTVSFLCVNILTFSGQGFPIGTIHHPEIKVACQYRLHRNFGICMFGVTRAAISVT